MSLEDFEEQARMLVRWHRERNYSVGGRIRQLARYQELTDSEILAIPFSLDEAQEVIAREQGFSSWAELRAGQKKAARSVNAAPVALRLTKAMPVVLVSDVSAAAEFYRDQLGFAIDFLHGHPAFYGSVSRDEACLHLRFVHEPAFDAEFREREQCISAVVAVANVEGLFQEYENRGVNFIHRLRMEPWGQLTFMVRDPDGNYVSFAG